MALKEVKFWTEFLTLYRSLPAVWQVKSKDYGCRALKAAAYDKLVRKLKVVDRHATRETVVRKINTFRTVYRRDLRKMSENPKYKSGLWYFDLLHSFLKDQNTDNSIDEIDPALQLDESAVKIEDGDEDEEEQDVKEHTEEEEEDEEVEEEEEEEEEEIELDNMTTISRRQLKMACERESHPQPPAKRGRKTTKESFHFLECESGDLVKQEHNEDISTVLAHTWASQYKELSPKQKILARKMISDIFFFGCLNQLDEMHPLKLQKIIADSK